MIDGNQGQRKPVIVSICGPSNAGKSQVAKETVRILGKDVAARVPTDYFLSPEGGKHPLRWDWETLDERLRLPPGTRTTTPDFDFDGFRRRKAYGGLEFTVRATMLCDAMEPHPASDVIVLIDVPASIRRKRLAARDRRWGTTVADRWGELDDAWRRVAPVIGPDLRLDGALPIEVSATAIATYIRRMMRHMPDERRNAVTDTPDIVIGMRVVALDGERLGIVREVQDYYILVDQPDARDDLEVPSDAIGDVENGVLRLTVNRSALSAVDDEESVHRDIEWPESDVSPRF